jgi:ribosomal protein L37AE/L43A
MNRFEKLLDCDRCGTPCVVAIDSVICWCTDCENVLLGEVYQDKENHSKALAKGTRAVIDMWRDGTISDSYCSRLIESLTMMP